MYRAESFLCPACGARLARLAASTAVVHACSACGGAWLGPEASVGVMRGLGSAVDEELARITGELANRATPRDVDDRLERACPACAGTMAALDVAGVRVDSCAAHGTWFDRDEVARVVVACEALRAAIPPDDGSVRPGAPLDLEGVLVGVGKIGFGVTRIAVEGVLAFFQALLTPTDRDDDWRR